MRRLVCRGSCRQRGASRTGLGPSTERLNRARGWCDHHPGVVAFRSVWSPNVDLSQRVPPASDEDLPTPAPSATYGFDPLGRGLALQSETSSTSPAACRAVVDACPARYRITIPSSAMREAEAQPRSRGIHAFRFGSPGLAVARRDRQSTDGRRSCAIGSSVVCTTGSAVRAVGRPDGGSRLSRPPSRRRPSCTCLPRRNPAQAACKQPAVGHARAFRRPLRRLTTSTCPRRGRATSGARRTHVAVGSASILQPRRRRTFPPTTHARPTTPRGLPGRRAAAPCPDWPRGGARPLSPELLRQPTRWILAACGSPRSRGGGATVTPYREPWTISRCQLCPSLERLWEETPRGEDVDTIQTHNKQ